MSAIKKINIIDIQHARNRETYAASCGYVPFYFYNAADSMKVYYEFIAPSSVNHELRVVCDCKIGSLWKFGCNKLEDIGLAICSNDECTYHNTIKMVLCDREK